VQRLARENGLLFAPDPGAAEQSQIGGNVATNAGGPHALKYGVTGAWVTGLEAVLAPGELVHVGGWARKDVAGYDVKSLLVGSEGTLGVITAVRLRLLPARETALALVVFVADRAAGCAAMLDVLAAGIEPSALDFLDGATLSFVAGGYPGEVPEGAGFALLVEVDGSAEEAGRARDAVVDLVDASAVAIDQPADRGGLWRWRDSFNGVVTGVRGAKVSEDVSFPVERLREAVGAGNTGVYADPVDIAEGRINSDRIGGLSILNGYGEFVCRGHVQACVEFSAAGIRPFQPAVSDFAAGSSQHQFCAVVRLFRPRARHIRKHVGPAASGATIAAGRDRSFAQCAARV